MLLGFRVVENILKHPSRNSSISRTGGPEIVGNIYIYIINIYIYKIMMHDETQIANVIFLNI